MFLPEAIAVVGRQCELVPVAPNGKRPLVDKWEQGVDDAVLLAIAGREPTANVGILARYRPAIDIDILDDDCASAVQLACELELGFAPVRVGQAPKRLLMYQTSRPFKKMKLTLRAPDGSSHAVEVLGDGQQYVVGGVHPCGASFTWNTDDWWSVPGPEISADEVLAFFDALPSYLPGGWSVGPAPRPSSDLVALAQQPLDGWNANRIIDDVLPYLDPNCPYDEWLRVGQALHHQFAGAEEGLELWDDWSSAGASWAEGVCAAKWDSFGGYGGRQVTLATLLFETRGARDAARASASAGVVEGLLLRVAGAAEAAELETDIAAEVRRSPLLDVDRERLAVAIRDRAVALGAGVNLTMVRRWVRRTGRAGDVTVGGEAPEWARDWVFCANGDKFFSLKNKEMITMTGFRAMHNRLMPVDPDTGGRQRADLACLEQWNMPVVANLAYVPWAGPVFHMNGSVWGNLFRDDLIPEVPVALSADDREAVAVLERHAELMFPDERERGLMLSWCAWQVQQTGRKVRWAPYLFGVEGDGKSFWAELVAAALGPVNVRSVTAKVLESAFTDWAVGAAVVVLEEMKQQGHNRYDVMNALKPLITNNVAEIHPKGRAPYMAPNTSNYLLLSNYMDGAAVIREDRRYMFLRSGVTMGEAQRLTLEGYYSRLFGVLADKPGVVRWWLLGMPLHPEFSADGRAPHTEIREAVVEAVKPELDCAVEDVIEDEHIGDVLVFARLVTALKLRGVQVPGDRAVAASLNRLGYSFTCRAMVESERARIWVKGIMAKEEAVIRAAHIIRAGKVSGQGSGQL
jgi:hypothetical protein